MNNKILIYLSFCLTLFVSGCSKEISFFRYLPREQEADSTYLVKPTLLSGIAYPDSTDECDCLKEGASCALMLTGDIQGCFYVFIDEYKCGNYEIYIEKGRGCFVGTYKGKPGSFRTTYQFEAKQAGCAINGRPLNAVTFGTCQHSIAEGTGEGIFEGVTGQMYFVGQGKYPYRYRVMLKD